MFDEIRPTGSRRGLATLLSLVLQLLAVTLLLVIPLIYTEALPLRGLKVLLEVPLPSPGPAPAPPEIQTAPQPPVSELHAGVLLQPSEVPSDIPTIVDSGPPIDPGTLSGMVPGGTGSGGPGGGLEFGLGETPIAVPAPPQPPTRARISPGVAQGYHIRKVTPVYPELARRAGVQGRS